MPSKACPHPEERPKGASRRTQDRDAAFRFVSCQASTAQPILFIIAGLLTRTYGEPTCRPRLPGSLLAAEIINDPFLLSCYPCFSGSESRDFNSLLLISFAFVPAPAGIDAQQ
jgi:hypothetical protein